MDILTLENMIPDAATYIESERDLMPGDTGLEKIVLPDIRDHLLPGVNQSKSNLLKNSCTITGTYRQLSRLWNQPASQEEAEKIAAYARDEYKWDPSGGWESLNGAKAAVNKWNGLYSWGKSMYLRVNLTDALVTEALKKWHFVGFTYQWDAGYNADFSKDNILDGTKFGKKYGHRTNFYAPDYDKDQKIFVHDSYEWASRNQYLLKNGFAPLQKSGCFYSAAYIIIPQDERDLEKLKAQKKDDNVLLAIAAEKKIWNTQRPDDPVILEELNAMMKRRGVKNILGGIWSQKLTRSKCVLSIASAFGRDPNALWNRQYPTLFATRKQAVLMVMRASI